MQKFIQKQCKKHGIYEHVLEGRGSYRCKRCRTEAVLKRRRVVKEKLVAQAGGKCQLCSYNQCLAALQFHHLDKSQKSFGVSAKGLTRSYDKALLEANKCVLLCANCHAEVECGFKNISLLKERRDGTMYL